MRALGFWVLLAGLVLAWIYSDRLLPAEILRAETAQVRDGDTLTLAGKTVRLYGIDAPEYRQMCADAKGVDWPCGKAARLQLAALTASGSIACETRAQDRYGRDVASCSSATVPDLAAAMVQAGLAISPAERGSAAYEDAEAAAKATLRGIWQGPFKQPAEWRAEHPQERVPPPVTRIGNGV